MATWDGFVDGPGRTTALRAVLACLGETDTCEALIARLAAAAKGASLHDDRLVVRYVDPRDAAVEWTLTLGPPYGGAIASSVPTSLGALACEINGITLETDDMPWTWPGLTEDGELAQPATFDPTRLEDEELVDALAAEGLDAHAIVAPIQLHEDWVVYHPFARTVRGEPALCIASRAAGVLGDPLSYQLGFPASVLRLLVREILDDDHVPWDEDRAKLR